MEKNKLNQPYKLIEFNKLKEKKPTHSKVLKTDLVVIRYGKEVSVLYGRCLHRGALLGDGYVDGENLICGVHGWDYRFDTGVSEYNNQEVLYKFKTEIKEGSVFIDLDECHEFEKNNPSPFNESEYLGRYADTHPAPEEPYTSYIKELAKNGLKNVGKDGPGASMGVDRNTLPLWNDIQYLPAQFAKTPLLEEEDVLTKVVIGPRAKKPLHLDIPLFVSDMSFGALSREAKIALAKGAELAGTGICSGEGGMLPEENDNNSKYFYELASAQFGFSWDKLKKVQAFHFKGGQGAKTGTGGHLPADKVSPEIAEVRGLKSGEASISPSHFLDLHTSADFKRFADEVREKTGGIPIGFKLGASHIEADIDFALAASADYIILDGRGGGTGYAPEIFRDHINVPTIPALARARKHLNNCDAHDITLVITGGLRVASDFVKALMMGADAIAVSNSALQSIGCLGMRACGTDFCPVGIATQKESLRSRIIIDESAKQLSNFFIATNSIIKTVARGCGYDDINKFNMTDLSTFNYNMHRLTGINFAGTHGKS